MAVSCVRNASGHNYRNSSVIVVLAVGQIYHVPQNVFLVDRWNRKVAIIIRGKALAREKHIIYKPIRLSRIFRIQCKMKWTSTPHHSIVCLCHYRSIGQIMTLTFDLWPWKVGPYYLRASDLWLCARYKFLLIIIISFYFRTAPIFCWMALKSVKIREKNKCGNLRGAIDKEMSPAIICIDVKKTSKQDRP